VPNVPVGCLFVVFTEVNAVDTVPHIDPLTYDLFADGAVVLPMIAACVLAGLAVLVVVVASRR
jgi:hypothetical protein